MKKSLLALLSSTLSILTISYASAQTPQAFYWDPSATGPTTGGSSGGSGNWDQEDAFWYDGISADDVWTNANNPDAYFTNTAGTVTLTENITAADIYFTNAIGNYYITNATGAEQLTVNNTIDTGTNEETIAAPLDNSSTLNINGTGRLHLPVSDNLSGNVMVNGGSLSVENNNSVGGPVTVAAGAALELNGTTNNNLNNLGNNITISGTGIANGGALRNVSGFTTYYGQIALGQNNSEIYANTNTAFIYWGSDNSTPLTDNGNNYNLIIAGPIGNVQFADYALKIGGSLIISNGASCFMYISSSMANNYTNSYVSKGAELFVQGDNGLGSQPFGPDPTNIIVDGGTLDGYGTWYMNGHRGIMVTTNGGTISDTDSSSGADWYTGSIISSNTSISINSSGGTIRVGGATNNDNLNIGTGTLTLNGGNIALSYLPTAAIPIYSNLVVNGCTFTFNYDSGGGNSQLGSVPSAFAQSNIWVNGGQLHVGHSTAISANRGIYVGSSGATLNEVTSSGTATWSSAISGPGGVTFSAATHVLSANNTYGNTAISSSTVLKVGNAGSTGTLGTGNTANAGTLDFNRTGTYTYAGVISGAGVVNDISSGVITLTGKNTYTGATTLTSGTLLANTVSGSSTGTGAVAVNSGGALGGSGNVAGAVTVASGGKLSLGLSTLTISNNLTLNGNVSVFVNKSLSPSSGEAVVTGTFTDGTGTITVTNLGTALAPGDTFQLFSKAASSGGTMTITGGGTGVTWNNNLAANGTISVASVPVTKPVMNQLQVNNGNMIFSVTNVSAGTYYELSTTNIETPLSAWTPVATNTITGNQFFITNPINPGNPQQYFIMQTQ